MKMPRRSPRKLGKQQRRQERRIEQRIPTTEKLMKALQASGAPTWMIECARIGYYDEWKSTLALPLKQLVDDARANGLTEVAERAINGDFDGQDWEADEWRESPEGRATFQAFMDSIGKEKQP
jgi:hypothetical protein